MARNVTRGRRAANRPTYRFCAEPVHNLLASLFFLELAEDVDGLSEWITATYPKLSKRQRQANRVICDVLWEILVLDRSWTSFPAYLRALERRSPISLRDDYWKRLKLRHQASASEVPPFPAIKDISRDADAFYEIIKSVRRFKETKITPKICAEGLRWLADPARMKARIVTYLGQMWYQFLREEYQRIEPRIQALLEEYGRLDLKNLSPFAVIRRVLERDLRTHDWDEMLMQCRTIIFTPSVHIGPYATLHASRDSIWIIFGVPPERQSEETISRISRSLLLVRLSALADGVRLGILEMIARQGEVTAQEIMSAFDLTQPTASRHLVRLCATGLITERRQQRVKGYRINPDAIREALDGTKDLLL